MNDQENIDSRIIEFIKKHHVLTLATATNSIPYCANCFYVYLEKENAFIFSSDLDTRHAREALENNHVAGSIVLETNKPGLIRGLQFQGIMEQMKPTDAAVFEKVYLKKFPYARLMTTELWVLTPTFLKFTDNRLGFGKKLVWKHKD